MVVRLKERELAAIAISVAAGCKPCTDHHVKAAHKARASDEDIGRAVAAALRVRRRATGIMEAHALAHLGIGGNIGESSHPAAENRTEALARIGAAYAVNCVSSLKAHMAAAGALGVSKKEMAEIASLAAFIKEKAASHVEHLSGAPAEEAA